MNEHGVVVPQGLDFGPSGIHLDSNNLVPELTGLAGILFLLLAFKLGNKLLGKL